MKKSITKTIHGSLQLLEFKITEKYPNIDTSELMSIMPKITGNMPPIYRSIFTGFYWRRMSINDIEKIYGLKEVEAESILESATELFMSLLYNETCKK
jgi:hypothetical protein